jgi:hypothetical protein
MPLTSLAVLGATILLSSFISGTFGMAGGMVLLGVLLIYFPVSAAMVLFSLIQFASNGWRAVLWWRFVLWPIFFPYVAGAIVAFAALRLIAYVPDKATVYLLLGAMPFAIEALPAGARPNIQWRGMPFVTGFLTTIVQFMAGVGGPFLDARHQGGHPDLQPCAARALFRLVRRNASLRFALALPVGDPGRGGRDLARADPHRAHDRPRLPPVDARPHPDAERGLAGARRLAVLARVRRGTSP